MVAGPARIAVEEAVSVLRQGGNAVDAAVTMAFVLAVTHPQAGNLGGGGYMLIRSASGDLTVIDYRETAPAAASRDMFLDEKGDVIPRLSLDTHRAAGVPGTVAGMALALETHGTRSFATVLSPAIRLAREGFRADRGLEEALDSELERVAKSASFRRSFFKGTAPLREGDLLVQEDLARTLETLSYGGPAAFYKGRIARDLAADMKANGGLITAEDLASYKPIVRAPLTGAYRSFHVVSAPPSSSGGAILLQILNMLEPFDLRLLGHNSSAYIHLVSEAMKRAFADRSRWLGDPEFIQVPLKGLLARDYGASLMKGFDPDRATPASGAGPGDPTRFEKDQTTHFSIVDAGGMVVSNTYTLNDSFGSGIVASGLGFLLNNEMDDFSLKPGVPNLYGLVGSEANSVAAGKRMLSSMAPTIVLRQEGSRALPFLVLGTPGGSGIPTAVLQVLLNILEFDMELQEAVDAPRFHHQWLPDQIRLEAGGFAADVQEALRKRGHSLAQKDSRVTGDVQAILVDRKAQWLFGASDARGHGVARGH